VQIRKPPIRMAAGKTSFSLDIISPVQQDSNCIATALGTVSVGFV
jgi:hypothetical protein